MNDGREKRFFEEEKARVQWAVIMMGTSIEAITKKVCFQDKLRLKI
jgi:hypothetical protein